MLLRQTSAVSCFSFFFLHASRSQYTCHIFLGYGRSRLSPRGWQRHRITFPSWFCLSDTHIDSGPKFVAHRHIQLFSYIRVSHGHSHTRENSGRILSGPHVDVVLQVGRDGSRELFSFEIGCLVLVMSHEASAFPHASLSTLCISLQLQDFSALVVSFSCSEPVSELDFNSKYPRMWVFQQLRRLLPPSSPGTAIQG